MFGDFKIYYICCHTSIRPCPEEKPPKTISVSIFNCYVPCSLLPANILQKYQAGVPVGIFQIPTDVEHYGNAKCEAEQEYDNGAYSEKAALSFTTTVNIPNNRELAFIVKSAEGRSCVIGQREEPFPIVEISEKINEDTNINEVKVTFTRLKSLIPCVV